MQNKKALGRTDGPMFGKMRTFSKKNFDFLTSKFKFHADVPVWGVIRMQFPTFLYIQNFHTTKIDENRFLRWLGGEQTIWDEFTNVRTFGMTFQTLFSFIIWV